MAETKQIQVLLGPYRDRRLTVPAAEADAAISAHWAVDPHEVPDPENPHPPLDEAERTAALEAAQAWAQTQWDTAQGVEPPEPPPDPPPEGGVLARDLKPDDKPGGYTTRQAPAPSPAPATPPKRR